MKKLLIICSFAPTVLLAQQTITSVQNGNASNPFTWDCTCFPTTNDHVVVNHAVAMDVNWAVTGGGSITVNMTGSLIQAGTHDLLIDGAGSTYANHGTSSFNSMAYTNGASGTNSGHFSINKGFYIGVGSAYNNGGLVDGVDSLLAQGTFLNNGTSYFGNFLNTGSYDNYGILAGDSVGNTGTFSSYDGYMYFNAFGNTGTFSMTGSGFMDVNHNWLNAGDFTLGTGLQIFAHTDFYNGDTLGGIAFLHNNGLIQVSNNFYNSHSIDGSGNFCITNDTYNSGNLTGTFDFCDNTGGGIDYNIGTVAGTISFCTSGCFVGAEEEEIQTPKIFPNPSQGEISILGNQEIRAYHLFSLTGEEMENGTILNNRLNLDHLQAGVYFIQLETESRLHVQRFVIE